MARLCERPGCSATAACVYGIDSRCLSVWIDGTVPDEAGSSSLGKRAGVLCRRHADSMVVPIGWTLDDRRTTTDEPAASRRLTPLPRIVRRRPRRTADDQNEQLALIELPDDDPIADPIADAVASPVGVATRADHPVSGIADVEGAQAPDAGPVDGGVETPVDAAVHPPGGEPVPPATPWRPVFDQADDLGGLLATRSPLLARAFGKRDRAAASDEQADR